MVNRRTIRNLMLHRSFRLLLMLTLLWPCAGCPFNYPRLRAVEQRELPKAIAIAEQLGYTPDSQLVQVRHCAPSLVSLAVDCYLVIAYEVDRSSGDFSPLVAQLPFEQTLSYAGDGRELFQLLNHAYYRLPEEKTHPPLTINGNAGSLHQKELHTLPEFLKYEWRFHYTEEQSFEIGFYKTAPLEPHPILGERVVLGNIAVITFEIGVVLP
jgi:hypothetical protein